MFLCAHPRLYSALALFLCAYLLLAGGVMSWAQSAPISPSASATSIAEQEQTLRRAANRAPSDPEVQARLGKLLVQQNQMDEAVIWLEKALKLRPSDPDTRRTLATVYWQLGHLQSARSNFDLVLQAKPQDEWASLLLGMVEEDLGNHARAAQLLTSVIGRVRQRPEAQFSRD